MARFWKEFKYSLRMRKHIFFLLMVIMGLVSAVYLFRESLQSSLEKAFPNEYGIALSHPAAAWPCRTVLMNTAPLSQAIQFGRIIPSDPRIVNRKDGLFRFFV